jgi:hypothetical protein
MLHSMGANQRQTEIILFDLRLALNKSKGARFFYEVFKHSLHGYQG